MAQLVDVQLMDPSPWEQPRQAAAQWAPILKVLGDPTRLEIALRLVQRSHSVKELQEGLGLNQALVSHHLRLLREEEIVEVSAVGRSNLYALRVGPLACLTQCLASMASATAEGLAACATTITR